MMLDAKQLETFLFKKYFNNEILFDYDKAIRALASICDSKDKIDLLDHLLTNINIYSEKTIGFAVQSIYQYILNNTEEEIKTAIVATAFDSDPDSSQLLMYKLKPLFYKQKHIKLFSYMPKLISSLHEFDKVFILDEFSGTGKTIVQRHKTVKRRATELNREIECGCILVGAMEEAITHIENEGITLFYMEAFKAGISGYFEGPMLNAMTQAMLALESQLEPKIDETELPSFGYGKAESMFCLHKSNAPNSNFPILWWPRYAGGKEREPIFMRNQ